VSSNGLFNFTNILLSNQMMINLDKREEGSRIPSASDELTTPSVEDKYECRRITSVSFEVKT
jgi:hypothetical protein